MKPRIVSKEIKASPSDLIIETVEDFLVDVQKVRSDFSAVVKLARGIYKLKKRKATANFTVSFPVKYTPTVGKPIAVDFSVTDGVGAGGRIKLGGNFTPTKFGKKGEVLQGTGVGHVYTSTGVFAKQWVVTSAPVTFNFASNAWIITPAAG